MNGEQLVIHIGSDNGLIWAASWMRMISASTLPIMSRTNAVTRYRSPISLWSTEDSRPHRVFGVSQISVRCCSTVAVLMHSSPYIHSKLEGGHFPMKIRRRTCRQPSGLLPSMSPSPCEMSLRSFQGVAIATAASAMNSHARRHARAGIALVVRRMFLRAGNEWMFHSAIGRA